MKGKLNLEMFHYWLAGYLSGINKARKLGLDIWPDVNQIMQQFAVVDSLGKDMYHLKTLIPLLKRWKLPHLQVIEKNL